MAVRFGVSFCLMLAAFIWGCTGFGTPARRVELPFEEILLLLPKTTLSLTFSIPSPSPRLDVGIDFDGDPNQVQMKVRTAGQREGTAGRVSGSIMRKAVCGVEITERTIEIHITNRTLSSLPAAIRLAPAGSAICSPPAPTPDEYWANLPVLSTPPLSAAGRTP